MIIIDYLEPGHMINGAYDAGGLRRLPQVIARKR